MAVVYEASRPSQTYEAAHACASAESDYHPVRLQAPAVRWTPQKLEEQAADSELWKTEYPPPGWQLDLEAMLQISQQCHPDFWVSSVSAALLLRRVASADGLAFWECDSGLQVWSSSALGFL